MTMDCNQLTLLGMPFHQTAVGFEEPFPERFSLSICEMYSVFVSGIVFELLPSHTINKPEVDRLSLLTFFLRRFLITGYVLSCFSMNVLTSLEDPLHRRFTGYH